MTEEPVPDNNPLTIWAAWQDAKKVLSEVNAELREADRSLSRARTKYANAKAAEQRTWDALQESREQT